MKTYWKSIGEIRKNKSKINRAIKKQGFAYGVRGGKIPLGHIQLQTRQENRKGGRYIITAKRR